MRLIDADELIKLLTTTSKFTAYCEDCTPIGCVDCVVEHAVKNSPTIEAKPIIRAHWSFAGDGRIECSNCGEMVVSNSGINFYCSNCGADMRCGEWETEDTEYGKYMRCPFCHYDGNGVGGYHCPNCGASMKYVQCPDVALGAVTICEDMAEWIKVLNPYGEVKNLKCSNCGTETINGTMFCKSCGKKMKPDNNIGGWLG